MDSSNTSLLDEMLVSLSLMLSGFSVMLGGGCFAGGRTIVCCWASCMVCSFHL